MMTSRLRQRWLVGIVFSATAILLIALLGGLPTDADGPPPQDRLAALVTCLLPANPGGAPSVTPSTGTTEIDELDCDQTWEDPLRTAWISAC